MQFKKCEIHSLSIIVTIFRPSRGLDNLFSWILDERLSRAQIILIHDETDGENIDSLASLLQVRRNVRIVRGRFGSPGASRNAGLEYLNTNWVVFWDFDDKPILDSFLSFFCELLESNLEIGVGSFNVIESRSNKTIAQKTFLTSNTSESIFLSFANPGLWRWIFRREVIGNTRFSEFRVGEDQLFLVEVDGYNREMQISQSPIYEYFVGNEFQQTQSKENFSDLKGVVIELLRLKDLKTGSSREFTTFAIFIMSGKYLKVCFTSQRIVEMFKIIITNRSSILEIVRAAWKYRQLFFMGRLRQNNLGQVKSVYFFGGLGNQLFQLAFALNLSKIFPIILISPSKSILQILNKLREQPSFKSNFPNEINVRSNLGKIEMFNRNLHIRFSGKQYRTRVYAIGLVSKFLNRFEKFTRLSLPKIEVSFDIGHDETLIRRLLNENISIVGYFRTYLWVKPHIEILESAIKQLAFTNSEIARLAELAAEREPIFVQIRLGDYKSDSEIGVLNEVYFKRSIAQLNLGDQNREIWIFSDEPDLAITFFDESSRHRIRVIEGDFSDLEMLGLLSCGSIFIISNSTYGWWGAFLSNPKISIVPIPWFERIKEPAMLIPSTWIRVRR